ncbi:alpha-amylase [Streptomyces sp. MS191]|uniref:alpha-amylase n=1 Tax=Streptomyces sp. ms191 TaxID=1827978 RepID=UPI0016509D6A|nr:alpha-amylase [Streptomyces sp. ms191]
MANHMTRVSRPVALAAMAAAGLLTVTTAPSAAADSGSPAPECVEYFQSWRYTDVHNGCGDTVSVTVGYVNGQWAPCRVIEPGGWATFSGYGTSGNYVVGLWTCDPATVPAGAVRAASDVSGRVDASDAAGWHRGASRLQ